MVFNFFGLKKKPVIEDVEAKVPTPAAKPAPMTFDEALAAQEAAESTARGQAAPPQATAQVAPPPVAPVVSESVPLAQAPTVIAADPAAPVPASIEPVVADSAAAETTAVVSQAEATPVTDPEVLGQMDTMMATREDVIAAYKIFLGRVPESMEVVDHRVGQPVAAVLVDFMTSKEFLDQPQKSQLVLAVAKKILEALKQAKAAEGSAPAE